MLFSPEIMTSISQPFYQLLVTVAFETNVPTSIVVKNNDLCTANVCKISFLNIFTFMIILHLFNMLYTRRKKLF